MVRSRGAMTHSATTDRDTDIAKMFSRELCYLTLCICSYRHMPDLSSESKSRRNLPMTNAESTMTLILNDNGSCNSFCLHCLWLSIGNLISIADYHWQSDASRASLDRIFYFVYHFKSVSYLSYSAVNYLEHFHLALSFSNPHKYHKNSSSLSLSHTHTSNSSTDICIHIVGLITMNNPVSQPVTSGLASNTSSSGNNVANSDDSNPTTLGTRQPVDEEAPEMMHKPSVTVAPVVQQPETNSGSDGGASGSSDNQERPVSDQNKPRPPSPEEELLSKLVLDNEKQNERLWARCNAPGKVTIGNGGGGKTSDNGVTKMRFLVCILGLMSLAMSQMSRMVINQTITQMVDPSMKEVKKDDAGSTKTGTIEADGSCPWTPEEAPKSVEAPDSKSDIEPETEPQPAQSIIWLNSTVITPNASSTVHVDSDKNMDDLPDENDILNEESLTEADEPTSQPADSSQTEVSTTLKQATDTDESAKSGHNQEATDEPAYDRFKWSMKEQGIIMGGFYYSYFVFMILGGRLAEIYGSKYVILTAVAGSALINLATPWMARTSFALLVMSRVCMGAIQAGVFPAMYALIGKWLTMTEASIFAPLIKMNLRLGMMLGSLIPGIVPGWPNVFYFTGFLSVIWSVAWLIIASSDPADCKWVSEGELKHIVKKKKYAKQVEEMVKVEKMDNSGAVMQASQSKPKRSLKTPWLKICTAPSVIGLILVKITFNYAVDFLAIELPSYLKYVHHASRETISAITTPMFGIQVCLIVFVGWLAKVAVQKRPFDLSKTGVRKLFQGVASFGMALCFFLLTFNDCNLTYVAILLQIISLLSMFTSGGETMLPYDLSEEYPATIMSIANSIANLSGITTPTVAGFVLADEGGSYHKWNMLIYLIVGANVVGGLAFMFLVKAEPIDFASGETDVKTGQKSDNSSKIVLELSKFTKVTSD